MNALLNRCVALLHASDGGQCLDPPPTMARCKLQQDVPQVLEADNTQLQIVTTQVSANSLCTSCTAGYGRLDGCKNTEASGG